MFASIRSHFPENKTKWKTYLKIFIPALIGTTFFALNSFIDNFMVGGIPQGVTALSAVNSWTNIVMGFFAGSAAAGSIVMAHFYHAKRYDLVTQMARLRLLVCLSIVISMGLISWIFPEQVISVFLKKEKLGSDHSYAIAMAHAKEYLRIIVFAWMGMAVSFNLGNQLRELGYGHVTMYYGIGTLAIHITLNVLLIEVFHLGVASTAWASLTARMFSITVSTTYMKIKQLPNRFKPWTIFKTSGYVWKSFFKRWFLFVQFASLFFFITFRNYFYDAAYPAQDNSPLGHGIGAMMILGLAGAIANIFLATFNVLAAMASNFVTPEITKNNSQQAFKNAKELKGFCLTISVIMSLSLAIIALLVPYMGFLSRTSANDHIDHHAYLLAIRNSLLVVSIFYPMWAWFMVSTRTAVVGKKGFWFSLSDWMISGPVEISWIAILAYLILPHWPAMQHNFAIFYAIFFLADTLRLIAFETLFYKLNWASRKVNITTTMTIKKLQIKK